MVEKQTISGKELLVKVEKADSRIESIDSKITDIFEQFGQINEEIGEIRSMVIEREKGVLEMRSDFEKVKDGFSRIEPERTARKIESFERTMLETAARAEKSEAKIGELKAEVDVFREKLGGIQSTENLADLLKDLDEKSRTINEATSHSERMASKAEKMFLEIDKRMPEMESVMGRIPEIEETINQIVRDIDSIKIELKTSVHKEDIVRIWNEIDSMRERPRKAQEIAEIPESGTPAEEFMPDIIDIPEPDAVEPKKAAAHPGEDVIPEMLKEAYGYLKIGGLTAAMGIYRKALESYKNMRNTNPEKAADYFEKINKLYKDILAQEKR